MKLRQTDAWENLGGETYPDCEVSIYIMLAREGDQMQAYLETFVKSEAIERNETQVREVESITSIANNLAFRLWVFSKMLYTESVEGFLRDSVGVMELHSNLLVKLSVFVSASSIGPHFQTAKVTGHTSITALDSLRRLVLFYFLITFGFFQSDVRSTGILNHLFGLFQIYIFRISILLTVSPFILGLLLSNFIWRMQGLVNETESCSCYVLGYVKRLQLTSLGRQISHPLPPVAKIEESARDVLGDVVLSCPEMRRALHSAFQIFRVEVQTAISTFNGALLEDSDSFPNTIQTIGQLQLSCSYLFRSLIPSCFQLILQCIKSPPKRTEEAGGSERVWRYLILPIFITDITCATERLRTKLILICREGNRAESAHRSDSLQGVACSTQADPDCISATYADARLQLLRLRNALEDTVNRVWLCEQDLSELEATRLLYIPSSDVELTANTVGGTAKKANENNEDQVAECDSSEHSASSLHGGIFNTAECSKAVPVLLRYKEQGAGKVKTALGRLTSLAEERLSNGVLEDRRIEGVVAKLGRLLSLLSDQHSSVKADDRTSDPNADSSVNSAPLQFLSDGQEMTGLCESYRERATFESVDVGLTDQTSNILRADETEKGMRVVDVYLATVTQRASQSVRRERIEKSSVKDDFNSSKVLLAELQKHIRLLDLGSSTVERVRVVDLDGMDGTNSATVTVPSAIAAEEGTLLHPAPDTAIAESVCDSMHHTNSDLSLSGYTSYLGVGNLSAELSLALSGVKRAEDTSFYADIDDDICDDDSYVEVENENI